MKTGKGAVAGSEETLSTTELDNGIFAKVPLKAGERMLYDAATAVEFPIHIYSRMWELQELTNNTYLENVLAWIDRYSFGCDGPGGEFSFWVSGTWCSTALHGGKWGHRYRCEAEAPLGLLSCSSADARFIDDGMYFEARRERRW